MSKKNRGRKRRTRGTHDARIAKMIERGNAWKVRNQLIPKRKQK